MTCLLSHDKLGRWRLNQGSRTAAHPLNYILCPSASYFTELKPSVCRLLEYHQPFQRLLFISCDITMKSDKNCLLCSVLFMGKCKGSVEIIDRVSFLLQSSQS